MSWVNGGSEVVADSADISRFTIKYSGALANKYCRVTVEYTCRLRCFYRLL